MNEMKRIVPPPGGNRGGSPFDQIMLLDEKGRERWSARDLQQLMGYKQWRQFEDTINRAMETVEASDIHPLDHFAGARKVMPGGRWGHQEVKDYRLTRFGAYQVALAGDGRRPQVAAAKTYFAVKTREAEIAPRVPDITTSSGVLEMANILQATALRLVQTEKELEVAKPKAGKWDTFCDSDGLIDMNAAAKAFSSVTGGLGRTKFMELLRREDIKFLQTQNRRLPYETHVKSHRAKVKLVQAGYQVVEQTFLTAKGMDWLADRLGVGAVAA